MEFPNKFIEKCLKLFKEEFLKESMEESLPFKFVKEFEMVSLEYRTLKKCLWPSGEYSEEIHGGTHKGIARGQKCMEGSGVL